MSRPPAPRTAPASATPVRLRLFIAATALVGAALAGIACSNSVTDPFYHTSAPVPAGLPASFRPLSQTDSLLGGRASVSAAGDSVAAVATGIGNGCGVESANAGVVGESLVITRLIGDPPAGTTCTLSAPGPRSFKIVVRAVPSGRYTVVLRERLGSQAAGTNPEERELTRGPVTLR